MLGDGGKKILCNHWMWGVRGREYSKGVNVRTRRRRGSKNQR